MAANTNPRKRKRYPQPAPGSRRAPSSAWQQCRYLMDIAGLQNPLCYSCPPNACQRMAALGLDQAGYPLPEDQRPECGARTRSGAPCRERVVPGKCRCRAHGGLSTGPKTRTGIEIIRQAQHNRWAAINGKPLPHAVDEANAHAPGTSPVDPPPEQPDPTPRSRRWRRPRRRGSAMTL